MRDNILSPTCPFPEGSKGEGTIKEATLLIYDSYLFEIRKNQ